VPFTRATTATRTNAAGLIELTPYNLAGYSEQFDNAYWVKSSTTVTANATTAPNGTLTADRIVSSAGSNSYLYRVFSFTIGTTYTLSFYVKADSPQTIRLYGFGTTVNLDVTTEWTRISITFVATTESKDAGIRGNSLNTNFDIYLWGAQLVEGTSVLPYLETVTRLNRPRVDFSLGGCPNLLLEPQRTNLVLRSEEFDNATWVKTAVSVTANSAISPSGVQNADTFTGDGTSSTHNTRQSNSVTNAVSYTFSCYVKKNTNNFIQLCYNSGFGGNGFANFDLNSGVVGTVGAGTTASISSFGNGWYRCSITAIATSTITGNITALCLVNSASSPILETNTLSTSVFLWGAQFELGAYPTSYIPTQAASVTRNQDSFQLSNVFTNNLISSAGGTWFVDFRNNVDYIRDGSGDRGLFLDTSSTGITNGFQFVHRGGLSTQRIIINKRIGGNDIIIYQSSVPLIKIAIKWNGATADVFANGTKVVNATAFTTTAMEFLNFITDGAPFNINSMALYNTPLSDDELEVITGEGFDTYALMASNYNYILQ
jgi:hypothetical protein